MGTASSANKEAAVSDEICDSETEPDQPDQSVQPKIQKQKRARCTANKTVGGKLTGKTFVVDGTSHTSNGGEIVDREDVVNLILKHGGTVISNMSKNVGEKKTYIHNINTHNKLQSSPLFPLNRLPHSW